MGYPRYRRCLYSLFALGMSQLASSATGALSDRVIEMLQSFPTTSTHDIQIKETFINFLKQNPNGLERRCTEGHITASGAIINPSLTHILLVHHKKLNLWVQPGGHGDPGELPLETARREVFEEVGLQTFQYVQKEPFDLAAFFVAPKNNEPAHYHYDIVYLFVSKEMDTPHSNEESFHACWFPFEDILNNNIPSLEPYIQRLVNKIYEWKTSYLNTSTH